MNDQPLRAFAPPAGLDHLGINLSSSAVIETMLAVVFVIWAIFTLVAIYHWLKYSHSSIVAFPAIALHLAISVALMSYGLMGTTFGL